MFQSLRQNTLFYILEKGDNLNLKVGQVVNVSNPQPKYNQFQTSMPYNPQQEMVVDVKVKIGDETIDFKQLPANLSIANSDNNSVVVSESKEAMSAEVEAMLRASNNILESIPYHQKVITNCDVILRELNPQFAKEKEQEEKIGALENRMVDIDDKLNKMFDLLSDTLEYKSKRKTKEE
jgi:ribosome-associated translation inhibitor RaiA